MTQAGDDERVEDRGAAAGVGVADKQPVLISDRGGEDGVFDQVVVEPGLVVLYEWRRIYAPKPSASGPAPRSLEDAQEEITRLRAEVVRLRERETILKKSLGILSEPPASGMPGSTR